MKTILHQRAALLLLSGGLGLAGTGCATYPGEYPLFGGGNHEAEASAREDMLILQQDIRKLQGRLETVEMQNEQLFRNQDAGGGGAAQIRQLQEDLRTQQQSIEQIERHLAQMEAARQRENKEMVDRLTEKISAIMQKSGGSSSSRGSPRTPSRATSGYEHTVEAGQTLSEIASAYGVTVKAILEANGLQDANRVRSGMVLFIPKE
jgi:nucleoid-associated protein YgaU